MKIKGTFSATVTTQRAVEYNDYPFVVSADNTERIISAGGTTPNFNYGDAVTTRNNTSSYAIDKLITVGYPEELAPTFSALTPSIATVDAESGQSTTLTAGAATIFVDSREIRQRYDWNTVVATGAVSYVFESYRTGFLARYLLDQMNALCQASTPGDLDDPLTYSRQRFFTNPGGGDYSQNLSNIIYRNDVANYVPANAAQLLNAAAYYNITPYHKIRAAHGGTNIAGVTQSVNSTGDNAVFIDYNSAGTNPAPYVKLLPSNYASFLTTINLSAPFASLPLWARRTRTSHPSVPYDIASETYWLQPIQANSLMNIKSPSQWASLDPFCFPQFGAGNVGCSGDSFSPLFLLINGEPILYGHIWGYGGFIVSYMGLISEFQTAMNTLSDYHSQTRQTVPTVNLADTSAIGTGAVTSFSTA